MEQLLSNFIAAGVGGGILTILLFWVLPWKGYALWTAAKRGEKWWFVALLVVNTLAILEIVYLFAVAKKKEELLELAKKLTKGIK